jgi:AraC family ethanolamine operon transcriptional activator
MHTLFLGEPWAAALSDRWSASPFAQLRADGNAVRRLRELARDLLASGCAVPQVGVDAVLSLVAGILLTATPDVPCPRPGRPSERRRLALAAEEVILAERKCALSVRHVCRAIGASERSLETAFLDHFGVTPARYLRAIRLHRAHRDLLNAGPEETVTDVAYRHGFWHLSRFAGYYRAMFEEPPSVTLARGLARRGKRPQRGERTLAAIVGRAR